MDSTNAFQTGALELQSGLHNTSTAASGRRNDKDAHLLTRYCSPTCTHTAHEGCQTDRLADKECEGHSGGRGRHPGSKRWCTVSAHAKSVTISTHVKPRLSAAATSRNPQTIWPNLENKWRVSSYINTQQDQHQASCTSNTNQHRRTLTAFVSK